jgi:hypothetical protein
MHMARVLAFATLLASTDAKSINALVFGDSYGDTGPTYRQLQKMFNDQHVPATVRSAAVGGTAACFWANQNSGNAIVDKAKKLFPGLPDGPDYLWYTAGANDVWQSLEFQACERLAKSWDGVKKCMQGLTGRVSACTSKMFKSFFQAFPKAKVLHSGYDVPCYNAGCQATFTGVFDLTFCNKNNTCNNNAMEYFIDIYHGGLNKQFSPPQYTTLKMMGAVQKAHGVPGADVGKPVLSADINCKWETECVHPSYNTPAGDAWGQGFWDLYFSKQIGDNTSVLV